MQRDGGGDGSGSLKWWYAGFLWFYCLLFHKVMYRLAVFYLGFVNNGT